MADLRLDNMGQFFEYFKPEKNQASPHFKLRGGILKDFMNMNTALFGKNYQAGRMWTEGEIKNRVDFIKEFDSSQLTNIMAKQADMVKNSPKWVDDIFSKVDKNNLEALYLDMNTMAKEYKFLAGLMGRTSFTIPDSIFVKKALDYRIWSETQRDLLAENDVHFKQFMSGINYTRNKMVSTRVAYKKKVKNKMVTRYRWTKRRETSEDFVKDIDNLSKLERREIIDDVYTKAQDFIVNDIHTMVTLKKITNLYDANKDILDMKTIENVFNEVERTKQSSYLSKKDRLEPSKVYDISEMTPQELEVLNFVRRQKIKDGEIKADEQSADMDQQQIDARIKKFKAGLKTSAEKNLYDILMLGSYNRNEMAQRGKVDFSDPNVKHEYIMKGAKTSLTQLGFASRAIGDRAIDSFLKDYMKLGAKSMAESEGSIKKAINALKKSEEVKVEVDQYGEVKLFESRTPEQVVDTYVEDLSGYEGLAKGKLTPEQAKIVTEVAENLKYYANHNTIKINELVREVMKKDINVMDVQDWRMFNNFMKDIRRGTFWSRLNGEKKLDMQQRFWNFFPKTVNRDVMKYDIEFLKKKGFFKTKEGKWKEGWTSEPTWFLEGLQDWNARMGEKAIALGEKLQLELNSTLSFYTDALPQGELLRTIAVRKMELGQVKRVLNETHSQKSKELRRIQADEYINKYIEAIEGSTKNPDTAEATGDAKIALNKSYNITNPDGTKASMTGHQIVDKIAGTYTAMNKRAHKIITGNPEALSKYVTGRFFRNDPKEPQIDWKLFIKDMNNRYRQGLELPTDLGIDGLRQIARSMMIDLAPAGPLGKKMKDKLMKTKLSKTGILDYSTYFPHMFHSKSESRVAMEQAIEAIKRDPDMPAEVKDAEIKKILLRTHNITGDWIDPGQEIWDSYDRATGDILAGKQKKEEFISWWDANQTMSSMHSRNTHIPGWSIDKNTYEVYLRNIGNTYFNQMNQIFSRAMIEQFRQKGVRMGWHKDYSYVGRDGKKTSLLTKWLNYLKLYSSDAMGNPSIIPEKIYNDPSMKLKGTPYYWWADNRVKKSLERMKSSILGENASKYKNLDQLLNKIDYSTLNNISNLEAKFELASLLAHPKSGVGNIFGGSMHSIQSAGFDNFKKARNYSYLSKINPEWKTKQDVDAFVTKHGVIPEFILYQFGVNPDARAANIQNFAKDAVRKMSKSGELDKLTFKDLAKKHNLSEGAMNIASKFMSIPERMLRRDAFMAHYIKAYEMFDGAIKNPDHPFLIEMAKKGVKATQFLYNAPYRPAFARTALGKIMSRFQLWQWNAVRFRNDMAREAKLFGLKPGMEAYDKFARTLQMDMFVMAMGSAFAYSIFDTAMPAPYSWFQDTADWLFGSEIERDRTFFGAWPKDVAPLQLVTPPIMRHPLSIAKSLQTGDWDRFANYHVYTMFPFGRLAKDFSPYAKNNLWENPMGLVDKWTGFPLQGLSRESKRIRKGAGPWYPWAPYGVER